MEEKNFGPIGIGGKNDEVTTFCYKDIGIVISNYPVTRLSVNRRNTVAHERVVERVMEEFSVLPVRFCTIASDVGEIKNLLTARYGEFKGLLKDMDHKIELNIKGLWKNMEMIYREITEENREIKKLKEEIGKNMGKISLQTKMSVGTLVENFLKEKKEREAEHIIETLSKTDAIHKRNGAIGDEMFINTAFLVDKDMEKEFDNRIDELSERYKDRIKFIYASPFPPYNFANVAIYNDFNR
jgi:hypothetical protein